MAMPREAFVAFPAFPFEPYPIQVEITRAVYSGIQKGGVTIVESLTAFRILFNALQWLVDQHDDSTVGHGVKESDSVEKEPDWMLSFEAKKEDEKRKRKEARKRTLKARLIQSNLKKNSAKGSVVNFGGGKESKEDRKSREAVQQPLNVFAGKDDDEDFIADDYCSDEESGQEG